MKYQYLPTLLLCILFTSCKGDEKLAVAGSGWNEIAIINKKTAVVEWQHELQADEECNDIEVTPKGDVLYAYKQGARLITREHAVIWDYPAGEGEEIHSASLLPDGGFLIGVCGQPSRIVELDKDGKQRKEVIFNTVSFDTHRQFRQIVKTNNDTYLVPLMDKRKIIQITPEGRNKGSVFLGYDLFSVKTLNDSVWVASCGSDRLFITLNPSMNLLEEGLYITDGVKGATLQFVGEIIPYDNGHALIANGKLPDGSASPLLIEIDEKKNVVWTLPYNKNIKNITSVYSFY
ncbi:MAG: hypothetical protein LBN11_03055 [Tannerella sp.]|jgi:hypothetical protein|nr:hypothetical protein [Tannerella sp.]